MADDLPSPDKIRGSYSFHDRLNPKFWQGGEMRPEVRLTLLKNAIAFYRFLDVTNLLVTDIHLTGSSAAFNYTSGSDLDVHLVVDFSQTDCPNLADNLFTTKKALWTDTQATTVRGAPVELYVEDAANPANSNGVYSLLTGEWVHKPRKIPPNLNDTSIQAKVDDWVRKIDAVLAASPTPDQIDEFFAKLKALRKTGLEAGGEYSTENLSYKVLRALGYLDDLQRARTKALDGDLTLENAL